MKLILTPLNLLILETVARYRLMTTEQVHRALSGKRDKLASVENFSNILRRLHSLGFLGRDWVAVRPAERTAFAKPSAVWHLKPEHLRAILAELERTERVDLYEPLRDEEANVKDSAPLAENTLRHELAITDFYAALDTDPARVALWLRTSPRHPAISRSVVFTQTDKKTGKKTERRLPLPASPMSKPAGSVTSTAAGRPGCQPCSIRKFATEAMASGTLPCRSMRVSPSPSRA